MWPCGSIASAVKLATIMPNENIISADNTMNSGKRQHAEDFGQQHHAGHHGVERQRAVRDHAHAERADKSGVEEAGDGGAGRDRGEGEREIMAEVIDAGEHLLRREHDRRTARP